MRRRDRTRMLRRDHAFRSSLPNHVVWKTSFLLRQRQKQEREQHAGPIWRQANAATSLAKRSTSSIVSFVAMLRSLALPIVRHADRACGVRPTRFWRVLSGHIEAEVPHERVLRSSSIQTSIQASILLRATSDARRAMDDGAYREEGHSTRNKAGR